MVKVLNTVVKTDSWPVLAPCQEPRRSLPEASQRPLRSSQKLSKARQRPLRSSPKLSEALRSVHRPLSL
eukprot:377938-Pyramimonas_sp.AAC.1